MSRCIFALLFAVVLVVSGCSKFDYSEHPVINKQALAANPPKSLAILPFSNASGVANANEVARRDLYAQLSGLGYTDVELSRVDQALSQLAVEYQLDPDEIPPPLIRRSGLADAVLSGQVESVTKRWALLYSHIRVAMQLQVIDARTNTTLYSNRAIGINQRFTAPTSLLGILTGAWNTLRHLRSSEIDQTLDLFAKKVAASFPNPSTVSGEGGLYLRDVILSLPRQTVKPGDEILLEFDGTPGQLGYMDIDEYVHAVRVPELEPGRYRLLYRIPTGPGLPRAMVRVRLAQAQGRQVEVSLYNKVFSIQPVAETRPASSPSGQ